MKFDLIFFCSAGKDCGFPGRPGNGTTIGAEKFFYPGTMAKISQDSPILHFLLYFLLKIGNTESHHYADFRTWGQNSHKWDCSKDSTNAKIPHLRIHKLKIG